jgi:hypothetical protein
MPRRFGYGPCPYRGERFPCRPSFPARGSHTRFDPRHLDGPHFSHCGSRPTRRNGEVQRTVKTSSDLMVKCWIPKIYLTNPSTEPLTSSRPIYVLDGGLEDKWLMDSGCSRHMTSDKKWLSNITITQGVCNFWG